MIAVDLDELYTTYIKPLPSPERLRLLAMMAQDLAHSSAAREEQGDMLTIDEHLVRAHYQGGTLFKTAEEVDAYIRAERDAWER